MTFKSSSGAGKGKAGRSARPSRPAGGGSARKAGGSSSASSSPKFSGRSGSSARFSDRSKTLSGKQDAKPAFTGGNGVNRGRRNLWLTLGALVLLALCCLCSLALAWSYGDTFVDLLRQMQ